MKKFGHILLIAVTIIFAVAFAGCGKQSNGGGAGGDSYANVYAVTMSVTSNSPLDYEGEWRNHGYRVYVGGNYVLEVVLLRTGGSTPQFILAESVVFEYNSDLIELRKQTTDDEADLRYVLTVKKAFDRTAVSVWAGGYFASIYLMAE